ncbi:nuclear transport factor 2 family protein [Streptomyces luteolus]|uniref:Nuclear transport factor 2 family protein n=1 Tax=Streptomyces luteolus TaxID=3043615 RepID=A0ABT6SSE6_9ACTN|nr:nuclear transport factor 2 family protein [Streptomyces sp. B-S-A12]MDI3418522.1 nuclear transport factor 2 family protein [Streptomyces sp. B-S-A12]
MSELTEETRIVVERWFDALTSGDFETALNTLAEDVEWINYSPVPGYNDDMKWIGTVRGRDAVLETLKVFTGTADVKVEKLINLVVEGDQAAGVIHEVSVVKETGQEFEIEFIQWLTVRDGHIVRWKSYTDPSQIIRALRGDNKAEVTS